MREATKSAALHTSTSDTTAPNPPGMVSPEEDADYFADDPEVIFRREWSKLDTVSLAEPVPLRVYLLFVLFILSFVAGSLLAAFTYPSVTITVTPVTKTLTVTVPLALPTRSLAPVTLTKTQTAPTSGDGYQDATEARGEVTFYNGRFAPQTVTAGAVLTGNDGVPVVINGTVTIPAATTVQVGMAAVVAHARQVGSHGNIAALDIDMAVTADLFARNLTPFTGGQDARDFPAVAQTDLASLTQTLHTVLVADMPQAFRVQQEESVFPLDCHFTLTADHRSGEEATTVTVTATATCKGIAYRQGDLQQQAVAVFSKQTRPDAQYDLLNTTPAQIVSVTPLLVRMSGTWFYLLSEDYQQFLAEQIAGETPAQAQKYLLATGVLTEASVSTQLPKDPSHIHFLTLIGA